MTNRHTRRDDGHTPPSAPERPAAADLDAEDETEGPTSLDAMYERFQALQGDTGVREPNARGWHENVRWQPDQSNRDGISRREARRLAGTYRPFTPLPIAGWDRPIPAKTAGDASEAEATIRALNDTSHPALKPLARLLLRTESIASSRSEGLQVGAESLARAEVLLEDEGRLPRSETAVEILRNIQAMETAIGQASHDRLFTVDDLCTIHAHLLPGARDAGLIRAEQNWIGGRNRTPVGADFVPPPHPRVPALLADLADAVNDDALPPVIQAAVVHAQFETIHPFTDGNGRTGRALIHAIWRRRGLTPTYVPPISLVFSNDRGRYIAGLTAFRQGHANDWFAYFADAATQAARRAEAHLARVQDLQEQWRGQVRGTLPTRPRRDAAVWALIDELPAHPAITSSRAAAALQRSTPVVNQAIGQLEQAGVLRRVTRGARNRVWDVPELLDLIEDVERG